MHPKLLKDIVQCLLLLCDGKQTEAKELAESLLKTIEEHKHQADVSRYKHHHHGHCQEQPEIKSQ